MVELDKERLLYTLAASTCWMAADEEPAHGVATALGWLRALYDEGYDNLPFVLVHDLGFLLLRGRDFRFSSGKHLALWDEDERRVRLRYEDELLGRWAVDKSVREAHIALAGLPDAVRDASIAHAIGLATARALRSQHALARANPAHLRDIVTKMPGELYEVPADQQARRDRIADPWRDFIRDQLQLLPERFGSGHLFTDEDVWEIAHFAELPNDSARLSLREVHRAQRKIGHADPGKLLAFKRRIKEVPLEETESDRYPTGGFDAVSTRGAFENLVRSEIAYVDEAKDILDGIDLFDLRFVESELLFYTRDESPLLDQRRELHFVIERPAELRTKDRKLPAQTLVILHGMILAMQRDLHRAFGGRGSHTSIHYLLRTDEDISAASEESALLQLTLEAELAHRRVVIDTIRDFSELSNGRAVVFSPLTVDNSAPIRTWVQAQTETWRVGTEQVDASDWTNLRELCTRVLLDLLI